MEIPRVVCHFSCGAASAVATKLALAEYGKDNVLILNAFVADEHPDNQRFLKDCESWFGHPITQVRDTKYGASARQVWRRKRYIRSLLHGAVCSALLKRELMDPLCRPDDFHVFGFTVEEADRAARFKGRALWLLIDRGLTKADCLAMIERAGIRLPEMYRLGYNNANCIGCCNGGKGYWNKIRRDFPEIYAETVAIQEEIGENSYFFLDPKTGGRIGLLQLDPDAGRHDEVIPDCSFFCAMAEEDMR